MVSAKKSAGKSAEKPGIKKAAKLAGAPSAGSKRGSATAKSKKPPARKATPASRGGKRDDAIVFLKEEHQAVKKLFRRYDKLAASEADDEQKETLARLVCAMLTQHALLEEEIFYPAAREALDEPDLLDEAEVEHASAKDLIAQIESAGPAMPLYDAKVRVLGEYIDHHVTEEEDELFPKLRKTRLDLVTLGQQLKARKEALTAGEGMEPDPAD